MKLCTSKENYIHVQHICICSSCAFYAREGAQDTWLLPALSDFHTGVSVLVGYGVHLLSLLLGLFFLETICQILLAKISTWEHIKRQKIYTT